MVAQNLCEQGQGSEFIATGKGGIAPSPNQTRNGEVDRMDLVEPATFGEAEAEATVSAIALTDAESEIVEAQGWIINDRGMVELVAHKTDPNSSLARLKDLQCHK